MNIFDIIYFTLGTGCINIKEEHTEFCGNLRCCTAPCIRTCIVDSSRKREEDGDLVDEIVGREGDCTGVKSYCNGYLNPGTVYRFVFYCGNFSWFGNAGFSIVMIVHYILKNRKYVIIIFFQRLIFRI